jgi:anti-sigma28 factor (negative regulator of flagellin synthesis)
MRIEHYQPAQVKSAAPVEPIERLPVGAAEATVGAHADQVSLSRLSRVLSGDGDKDAHLERLRLEVEAGSYSPPADELARRLVEFHLQPEK